MGVYISVRDELGEAERKFCKKRFFPPSWIDKDC